MERFILSLSFLLAFCEAGTFTDDLGQTFEFVGKPTVAVYGGIGARSLYHFGMGLDQITGVYGIWHIRGSDLDYDNPEGGSRFPDADPSPEEFDFLSQAVNLSPDGDPACYMNVRGCQTMNYDLLRELNPDYFLYIDNGSIGKSDLGILDNVTLVSGIENVVFIDTFYEPNRGCRYEPDHPDESNPYKYKNPETMEGCYARSMIDITKRIEELAVAMGVVIDDSVQADKEEMSAAAESFTRTMETAHDRGIRVMSAIARSGPALRVLEPLAYYNLRTYEELGMPLMHANAELPTYFDTYNTTQWFVNCPPGEISEACNDEVALPVDFWIIDSRSYPFAASEEFGELFPDRAILNGQLWHFARNDGAVSYRQITSYLKELETRIGNAERLYDRSDCTAVNVLSEGHYSAEVGGLNSGEYACYNYENVQQLYLEHLSSSGDGGDGDGGDGDGGDGDGGEGDGGDGDGGDGAGGDNGGGGGGFELCFSGHSIVKLEDETMIQMSDLKVGDRVQVTEDGKFDTVYSFGHYQPHSVSEYLSIESTAKAPPITISGPHMLFLESRKAVPASSIKVGDILLGGKTVTKIDKVSLSGAYAPFTYYGSIVVNEVVASNYVSLTGTSSFLGIDMQFIAHTAVGVRRALCQLKLCEENYSAEGIATWVPYHTAAWIAGQEASIGFLIIAVSTIIFSRRRQKSVL